MAKILIVEDDPLMGRMYKKIFTFEGYEVEVAVDGEEGWTKVKTIKPTIALLDIMMPKLNGIELLKKMKMDPETKMIPAVMLTNLAGEKDAEAALALGAVKYIVKSELEPKQVVQMVKEILAGYTRGEIPQAAAVNAAPAPAPVAAAPASAEAPVVVVPVKPEVPAGLEPSTPAK